MELGTEYEEANNGTPVSAGERAELDSPLSRPLAGTSDDALFAELRMRFDAFVFRGTAHRHDDSSEVTRYYHGRHATLVGLATLAVWDFQK